MSKIYHSSAALLGALALAMFAGCNADSPDRQATTGEDSLNGSISAAPGAEPERVKVSLSEYEIQMPTALRPGAYLFEVTNTGSAPHSFEIEGNTMEVKLPTDLRSGETQSLPVDLAPGTYRVYCPLAGHAERGMALQLTVAE